jgi:DNA-binding NarL/FixJ family response regulator
MRDITVLLCYPERLLCVALCSLLAAEPGIRVVGSAVDGVDAVAKAVLLKPAVAVIDERLNGLPAVQLVERLRSDQRTGSIGTILLSEQVDGMAEAIRVGVRGFLLRSSDQYELVEAIRATAGGEAFFTPRVAMALLRQLATGLRAEPVQGLQLTGRESDVLVLVADGLSNLEIAGRLFLSEATVKFHVSNLLKKLQLRNRLQIAVYAHRMGLV